MSCGPTIRQLPHDPRIKKEWKSDITHQQRDGHKSQQQQVTTKTQHNQPPRNRYLPDLNSKINVDVLGLSSPNERVAREGGS